MKIYTRTGDLGETCLFDGSRTAKDDLRLDLIGEIDELSANLGMIHSQHPKDQILQNLILQIIHDLFIINAHLAGAPSFSKLDLTNRVKEIEENIDIMDLSLSPLQNFIYPLGSLEIARVQLARTVCRRAERKIVAARINFNFNPDCLKYLNRLSDWLFTLARYIAVNNNIPEIPLIIENR